MKAIITKYFLATSLLFISSASLANKRAKDSKGHLKKNFQLAEEFSATTALISFYAVWKVTFIHENAGYSGSGFFIEPNKFVTALHVVDRAIQNDTIKKINLIKSNNSKTIKIKKVLALSVEMDLALLETEESVSRYLPIREQTLDDSLEHLTLLGYPNGKFRIIKNISQINNTHGLLYFNVDYIHLNGASGSPVIDSQGQIVAVASNANENTITVSILRNFIHEIEKFSCGDRSAKACLKESWDLLHQRAEEGNTSARYSLGFIYFEGYLLEKDEEQAKRWLFLAAGQDHPIAQHLLGFILYHEEDYKESMFWMNKAEKTNYPPAIYGLGLLMMREESDWEATMSQFRKAKETGHILSVYHLAMMKKTEGNMGEAMLLFIQAGEIGHAPSQHEIGLILKEEGNIEEAAYWFHKAAAIGYPPARKALEAIKKEKRH